MQKKETCPVLEISLARLEHNLRELLKRCSASGIQVAGVVKGFTALPEMVKLYETCGCRYIASSRIEQLDHIRNAGIKTPLMLLRVPMLSELEEVIRLADISLQSEREVLRALNETAKRIFAGNETLSGSRLDENLNHLMETRRFPSGVQSAGTSDPSRADRQSAGISDLSGSGRQSAGTSDPSRADRQSAGTSDLSGSGRQSAETSDLSRAGGQSSSGLLTPRRHQVILMADLGDLREGFWDRQELIDTALWIERELPCLALAGIGTNLTCYGSVKATPEKMQELLSLAGEVEAAIGRKLEYVCGGASSSLHMVLENTMPAGINLLRLGESIPLGHFLGCEMNFMYRNVLTLKAEIIEVKDKPSFPIGELTADAFGRVQTYTDRGIRRRALAAIGRADYGDPSDLKPRMKGIEVVGASSDHTILDVEAVKDQIHVGNILEFDLTYASMVYLTNTESVRIKFVGEPE